MKSAPAKKIYFAALQYAKANNLPFFTIKEQRKALRQYLIFQTLKN